MFYLLSALAGAMLPVQGAINARLGRNIGGPFWATTVSALLLMLVVGALAAITTKMVPRPAMMAEAPWWAWTGGLCGALVLTTVTAAPSRIGAAAMIALLMAGQITASIALDHFGALGLATHPVSPLRLLAAGLLLAGAAIFTLAP